MSIREFARVVAAAGRGDGRKLLLFAERVARTDIS
jgi:hypothetical protein